jgi:hypothetical protein
MTTQQVEIFEKYQSEYNERYNAYSYLSYSKDCGFIAYKFIDSLNNDIVIRSTTISGLSDNFEPFFDIVYILIEPNGNTILLNDVFNQDQINNLFQQLIKI